jgi:hypothetical protein
MFPFLMTLFLIGCANQHMPEGGPIDRTTPVIVSTYPDTSKQRNFSDSKIQLEFDRYVNERSVEEAIFISPHVGSLDFDWSGKECDITFSEKLKLNTTYVINIGTDVEDLNKNRMAHAYTFAFSTGSDIDRGVIEGRVYPRISTDVISGIMIFAYRLDGLNPDTLNPIIDKPDFITQTGKNGDFFLRFIPFGSYRIYAIRDEYRNLVYDRETDEYGVSPGILTLTSSDSIASGVLMKLAKEDTTGPRLLKVMPLNWNHVQVDFSESIAPSSITLSSFSAMDTISGQPLQIYHFYPVPGSLSALFVITEKQDSGRVFRFSVQGIADTSGNKINPLASTLLFPSAWKADTIGARLATVSIKDSTLAVDLQPVLSMTFSDALAASDSLDWITLLDRNKQPIPSEKKRISDAVVSLRPEKDLESRTWYTLRAELRNVHDWAGRVCPDSTKSWRFETLDSEDLSSVDGMVVDENTKDLDGPLYATAMQIGGSTPKQYMVQADATGRFFFPQITEGNYVFQSFRDRNRNGKYDSGKPFPCISSERFSSFSDTLKVRARWPLEGVKMMMK